MPASKNRTRPLLVLLLAALALASPGCRKAPHRPRNVIWILVDTLRADHLSLYGYPRRTSPALDDLASEAVTFRNARSQASCTYPSVNSMLTSRWPNQFFGQPGNAMGIPAQVPTLAEVMRRQGYRTIAVSASPVVRNTPTRFNPAGGFAGGFDIFDERCLWQGAECVNRAALPRLKREDKPFFLYLHYIDPHGPYDPPKGYQRQFAPGKSGKPFIQRGDPNPIGAWLYGGSPDPHVTPEDLRVLVAKYDDEIAYFDAQLKELLAALRDRGLLDDSILVFSADHGEEFLEHQHIKHCRSLFDASIHTPILIRVPGLPPRTLDAPVSNVDLAPTVLDFLGLDATALQAVGRTLRPLVEGRKEDPKLPPRLQFSSIGALRSVSDGRYKLIQDLAGGTSVLYDLQADPDETTDVLQQERPTFHRLREALGQWLQQTEGSDAAGKSLKQAEEAEAKLRSLGYLE
jgi:arylsulfatase A-like enzyme